MEHIISYTISGSLNLLFSDITSNPLIILLIFFGPIAIMPGTVITMLYAQISLGMFDATLIQTIGLIVTPFVAAIIAGRTGKSKGASFGGWMLACLIGSSALGVLAFINPGTLLYYSIINPVFLIINPVFLLIAISINAAINGVFYGCFALLFTKTEMY